MVCKAEWHVHETGFRRIKSDNCIYVWAKDSDRIKIPVFVDDLTIPATGPLMNYIKAELKQRFKMRDLGPVHYILGIQVMSWKSLICLIAECQLLTSLWLSRKMTVQTHLRKLLTSSLMYLLVLVRTLLMQWELLVASMLIRVESIVSLDTCKGSNAAIWWQIGH